MPDLQSELNKILTQASFDDEDGAKTSPVIASSANNAAPSVRQRCWEFIKNNPGATVGTIAAGIGQTTPNIAGSLHKLCERGDLRRVRADDGSGFHYFTNTSEYVVKTVEERVSAMLDARRKARNTVKKAKTKPIKWVQDKPAAPAAPKEFDPDAILAGLNVLQAKELLRKLNELFGV